MSVRALVIVTLIRAGALPGLELGRCALCLWALLCLLLSLLCSSSFHLKDALTTIGEKVCLEVSGCLALCGLTPFTTEKETVLKGQIQAVASPDDPIRRIIGMFGRRRVAGMSFWRAGRQTPLKKSRRV